MVTISSLYKSFNKLDVLKDINLSIQKGEIVALLGPSGSGKSTLLRCLNLLEIPSSGSFIIDGYKFDAKKYNKKDILNMRKKTAMVFQNYNLFANKTALHNITLALNVVYKQNKKESEKLALSLLKEVGLEDKKDVFPHMLSGGQQQRIAIARALALKPKVILFDEPTSALDPELVGEVLNVISNIKDQTMLIVTHEMEFARKVASRIVFMSEGRIVEISSSEEFFSHPKTERAVAFLENFHKRF
ncbi:amino acid ABC transporter ATP-binding protein [Helicobacter sp. 11S02629-2]|uniref:amino acid ABC transporter ATP-binding protein n=1 Tax=Helicobacter sp. 11S02629-2 TaxID=1476195 RepID=UPI000BA67085|nr:amino acid ABC transporter ATP-binding protein [Helicobacter sp. 11S02629-2]PAF44669.1 amino acid ABC transporter ATP-binding protein [Helicobacter sp. 11S02629-2]